MLRMTTSYGILEGKGFGSGGATSKSLTYNI